MGATVTKDSDVTGPHDGVGCQLALNEIDQPGAYVCAWTGYLLRMPPDAFRDGQEPAFQLMAPRPLKVTRISSDPFISLMRARLIAADMDLPANF